MFAFLQEMMLKRRLGPAVIVVSGLPRSGTSMMMKMLSAGGAELVTDNIRTADEDNPKGYFELEQVKELDKTADKSWLREHKGKVVKIISFLLKDLPDDCFYKVIFMRRNLDEVIASQNKMLVRRGEPTDESNDAKMIKLYGTHLRKVEYLMKERPNFDVLDVHYKQALDDPGGYAKQISRFLGTALDTGEMVAAVDKRLYRNRR